jgi:predicted nucleic acid-binding protein
MNVVVDSNVIAALLVGVETHSEEARAVIAPGVEMAAPALWEAEVANVLWQACRRGLIDDAAALERLRVAGRLGIQSVPSRRLWRGALLKALHAGIAACDALFVELAERHDCPLVTFDAVLLRAFPGRTVRPGELRA